MKNKIFLFVCNSNSGRSQMAEAFFNYYSKNSKAESAGTIPDKEIHAWTVALMKEVDIDVGRKKPKLLTGKMMEEADKIIVMDKDVLKNIPSKYLEKVEKWDISKLLGKSFDNAREIRNEINKKVEKLIKTV